VSHSLLPASTTFSLEPLKGHEKEKKRKSHIPPLANSQCPEALLNSENICVTYIQGHRRNVQSFDHICSRRS